MDEITYWHIDKTRERPTLCWDCDGSDHTDFIEMSGLFASFIVTYGVERGRAAFRRHPVFPMLRTFPNDTHSSYQLEVENDTLPTLSVNGEPLTETPRCFLLNGTVECRSVCEAKGGRLALRHLFFPTTDAAAVCEVLLLCNEGETAVTLSLSGEPEQRLHSVTGPMGIISAALHTSLAVNGCPAETRTACLLPGGEAAVSFLYSGKLAMQPDPAKGRNAETEYRKRLKRVEELMPAVKLDTGNDLVDTMFAFAELRAGESIFRTGRGDVHCPGGGAYYAAVWCNDQVEYAGPWQAYTGDKLQLGAAYNAYAWYYPFMDDGFPKKPLPSSVIAEATGFWNGAGDRGDAAMYLYGASRYALTCGNLGENNALWQAILWCADYCLSRKNDRGVILSDCDELEHRLPAGEANLCTNMLALGGLTYASRLAAALNDTAHAALFRAEAETLDKACEAYFAAEVHGFDTYRYYEGNTTLRSWICMPLCVDVTRHAAGTAAAIMSPYLMSEVGQLSEEGTDIAWDRSTLYGLRGMFRAGERDAAWAYWQDYCRRRLLGRHVPYAVEAWPEGGMRHLSAESALFCQIVTEGILAIDPLSFRSFSFVPTLPVGVSHLTLTEIHAFGETFSLCVRPEGWQVKTASGKTYAGPSGQRQVVEFDR